VKHNVSETHDFFVWYGILSQVMHGCLHSQGVSKVESSPKSFCQDGMGFRNIHCCRGGVACCEGTDKIGLMPFWCNGRLLLRVSPGGLLRLDTSTLPERLHHRRHRPLCPSLCPTLWDITTKTFLCPVSTMVGVFLGRECGLSGHVLGDGRV
jgi:hypothetical protein